MSQTSTAPQTTDMPPAPDMSHTPDTPQTLNIPKKKIEDLTDDEFIQLVKTSQTKKEIMSKVVNQTRKTLNERLNQIDKGVLQEFLAKTKPKYESMDIDELKFIVANAQTMTAIWEEVGYNGANEYGKNNSLINYLIDNNIEISHLDIPLLRESIIQPQTEMSKLYTDIFMNMLSQQRDLSKLNRYVSMNRNIEDLNQIYEFMKQSKELVDKLIERVIPASSTRIPTPALTSTGKFIETPLSDVLKENSSYASKLLKRRLIDGNLLENKCAICQMLPIWHGIDIEFQLDHINGIHTDNRLENLRLLCHICHSLTPTYGSRNTLYQKIITGISTRTNKPVKTCITCGVNIVGDNYCHPCYILQVKLENSSGEKDFGDRPSYHQLMTDIITSNYRETAQKYGVHDQIIRRWIRAYGYEPLKTKELNKLRKVKEKWAGKKLVLKNKANTDANESDDKQSQTK